MKKNFLSLCLILFILIGCSKAEKPDELVNEQEF